MNNDPSIFHIDYELIRRKYLHKGILNKGRDLFSDFPCLNHMIEDITLHTSYIMQTFSNLPQDLYLKKIDQLYRAGYKHFNPFNLPLIAYSSRKNEDKSYDLYIIYDFKDCDLNLEEYILKCKQENTPFKEEEIIELIANLIEGIYLGSKNSYEYADLHPSNIFHSKGEIKYMVSNLGSTIPKRFEKKYFCPADKFFNVKYAEKNGDLFCRSALFVIGMIGLQMSTLEDPNDLYADSLNEGKIVREDFLNKRIDSVKNKGFSEKFHLLLTSLLSIKEEKRIHIDELLRNEKNRVLLNRDTVYLQQKLNNDELYIGFARKNNGDIISQGIGDLTISNNKSYRGQFKEGKQEGIGAWNDGTNLFFIGSWTNNNPKEGRVFFKTQNIFFGNFEDFKIKGKGIWYALYANSGNILIFEGEFKENGEKSQGITFYNDGGKYEGNLVADKREGKGKYWFSAKKDKNKIFEGEWKDDKIDGQGTLHENGTIFEVLYEKGIEKSRKFIGNEEIDNGKENKSNRKNSKEEKKIQNESNKKEEIVDETEHK